MVGASLEVMDRDARKMRGERPFVFTNLKTGTGLDTVVRFVVERGMVDAPRAAERLTRSTRFPVRPKSVHREAATHRFGPAMQHRFGRARAAGTGFPFQTMDYCLLQRMA